MKVKLITICLLFFLMISFSVSAQYLEVALVSDIGGFGDNSYNDQLKEAINKVDEDLNLETDFIESKLMTEYLDNVNYFSEKKFDLIWGVGFTMEQAIEEAAQMYPETNYVIFDGIVEEKNVMSLSFKKEEAAFLAGVIAALESESSAVAFIGAKKTREIQKYQAGFRTGVNTVNSDIRIINKYIGSFNDFSTAKKTTNELVDQGVDIIFYAAGPASHSIIDTAIKEDIKLISLDKSDINLAPNNILTSILKNTDYLVQKVIEKYYNNNYVNEIKNYGIADNAFVLAEKQAEKMLSKDKLLKIEEYKQQFLAGEINIAVKP